MRCCALGLVLLFAAAACSDPDNGATRLVATLDPAQALAGQAVVVWYVSPEAGQVHGEAELENETFVTVFATNPPTGALFKAAAGIGVPAILTPGASIPDGPLDATAFAELRRSVIATSESSAFVWASGSVLQGGWLEAFDGGFSCGRCLPSGDSPTYHINLGPVLAPIDCAAMRFEAGSICPGFARVPDNVQPRVGTLPAEPVDLGELGSERIVRDATVPTGSAAVFGMHVQRGDVFTVTVRATGDLGAVPTLAGTQAGDLGLVLPTESDAADSSGVVYATSDTLLPVCSEQWLRAESCDVYFVVDDATGGGGPNNTFDLSVEPDTLEPFLDEDVCPLPFRRVSQCGSAGAPAFDASEVAVTAPQFHDTSYAGTALRNEGPADTWAIVTAIELEASSPQLFVLEPQPLLALASGKSVPIALKLEPVADFGCDLEACGWLVVHTFGEADSGGVRVPIRIDNSEPRIWVTPERVALQPQSDQDVVVSVTNAGEAALGLVSFGLTNNFVDLFVVGPVPPPVLGAGESAQITVSYRPTAPATGAIDVLHVRSTSTSNPDLMIPIEIVSTP